MNITIKRCPSWSKVSGMLAEWGNFLHRNAPLSPSRASEIAAHLVAASICKAQGLPMPKDWARAHPSLPYQCGATSQKIADHPMVKGANDLPTYWIECGAKQ
jgi:hypothetical protein